MKTRWPCSKASGRPAPEDHWLQMALGVVYAVMDQPEQALVMCEKARPGVPVEWMANSIVLPFSSMQRPGRTKRPAASLAKSGRISKERMFDSAQSPAVM